MNISNTNEQLLSNYRLLKDNSLEQSNGIKSFNNISDAKDEVRDLKVENSNHFKLGDEGRQVSQLQTLLKNSGHFKGVVNGYYGKDTESAVKSFQKNKGLEETGIIDTTTKIAIAESRDTAKSSEYSTVAMPKMMRAKRSTGSWTDAATAIAAAAGGVASVGMSGFSWNEDVHFLQVLCNQYGIQVDIDGKWGANTERAVKQLPQLSLGSNEGAVYHVQNVLKIPADGIFGSTTQSAVKQWQRDHDLNADGIVGADTWVTFSKCKPIAGRNCDLLRVGSTGERVRTMQMKLIFMGYNCGNQGADGNFGGGTESAVSEFQKDYNLGQDGIIGDETFSKINLEYGWRKIQDNWSVPADDPEAMENKRKLDDSMLFRQGDKSKYLQGYQQKLKELGFYDGETDGIFGGGTYNAVYNFQGSRNLPQDGIIGPQTIQALNEAKNSTATTLNASGRQATEWLQILCNQMGITDKRGNSLPQNGKMTLGTVEGIKQLPLLSTSTGNGYSGAVAHVQNMLKVNADGYYGSDTANAVRIWQSAHGISADGIVGEKTWETFAGQKLVAEDEVITNPITTTVNKTEVKDEELLAYQRDVRNLRNSDNILEGAKHFGKYLWDRFPGLWADMNEQNALAMGMEPEYAKLTGELSANLFLEGFTTVTVSGLRAYKNIKTGAVAYDSEVIAGSGMGNIAKGNTKPIYSIERLNNTGNFSGGALEHILEGELNARGRAVGFHYEGMPTAKGNIIQGTESVPNKFGVYTAQVEVAGVPKVSNFGQSSFFPKDWSAQDIVDGINTAYNSKVFKSGNEFYGYTSNGMKINMYINLDTNKIISAFPQY